MKVFLQPALNDANVDATQTNSQRQLAISMSIAQEEFDRNVPLMNYVWFSTTVARWMDDH